MNQADDVLVEIDAQGIAVITLNRPQRRNAVTGAMLDQLAEAAARLNADAAIRVAVLTGAVGVTAGVPVQAMTTMTTATANAMNADLCWVEFMPPPCEID